MTVRFKICGLTREEDVAVAVEAGASAVGFVLWPGSPRAVTLAEAARLARLLPAFVTAVPVMVEPTLGEIDEATASLRTRHVQLHGAKTPAEEALSGLVVVRAASIDRAAEVPDAWHLLLDAADPVAHGGTGRVVDWEAAAELSARRATTLAGGLHDRNVAEAIRRVRPAAVDVASGVESAPGRKRHEAIRAFARAVRSTESVGGAA